jgi:hypothetical protein
VLLLVGNMNTADNLPSSDFSTLEHSVVEPFGNSLKTFVPSSIFLSDLGRSLSSGTADVGTQSELSPPLRPFSLEEVSLFFGG